MLRSPAQNIPAKTVYGRIAAFFGGGNKNQSFGKLCGTVVREAPLGKYGIPSKYHLYLLKLDDVDDDDEKNDNDGGNKNYERNTLHMASSM